MTGEGDGDGIRAKAERLAALVLTMAGGEEAVRPEERAGIEEACERASAGGGEADQEAPALPEVLEIVRARPDLAGVSRRIEEARWEESGLADLLLTGGVVGAGNSEVAHGLGTGTVVLNVEGLDDPRQLWAVAEVAREAAGEPNASRVLLVGAESLGPRTRAELLIYLAAASPGPAKGATGDGRDGND